MFTRQALCRLFSKSGRELTAGAGFIFGLMLAFAAEANLSTVDVGNATANVVNGVATSLSFPLTRTGDSSYAAAVAYTTQDGSADAGSDYTATTGTATIPAGATTASISVPATGKSGTSDKQMYLQLLSGDGVGPKPSFAAAQSFATGVNTRSVAAADFNGDGKLDLVAVNSSDDTVSVLFGTTAAGGTTPAFATQKTFAVGDGPVSVATADINNDGKPDILVANFSSSTISVLLNTTTTGSSAPSFAAQKTYSTGTGAASVSAADINGDGKLDVVFVNETTNTVSVLLNSTTPGATAPEFNVQQNFATDSGPRAVVAVDVNGDGHPDLLVANETAGTVSVFLNTTKPTDTTCSFAARKSFATPSSPYSIAASDINGDGHADIVLANVGANSVSVLLNAMSPGATVANFSAQQAFAVDQVPEGIAAVDINGDGRPDLLAANESSDTISVLLNITAPGATTLAFAARQTYTAASATFVGTADINGDGRPDLLVADGVADTVSVLLNTTSASSLPSVDYASADAFQNDIYNAGSVAIADINGDGRPDSVVSTSYAGGGAQYIYVLLNTAAPGAHYTSFSSQYFDTAGDHPAFANSVAIADFNNDGKPDLLSGSDSSSDLNLRLMINTTAPGATTASFTTQYSALNFDGVAPTVADINGDGRPDVVLLDYFNPSVGVLLNTTSPGASTISFATFQKYPVGDAGNASQSADNVTSADLNGDGRPDLIVANYSKNTVSVLFNTTAPGATTASFSTTSSFAVGTGPVNVKAADLNGDGKPDLIVANATSGGTSILLNTTMPGATSPTFAALQSINTGATHALDIKDVNGDGRPDVVTTYLTSGGTYVNVFLNTSAAGASTLSFSTQVATTTTANSLVMADLNGDGRLDLLATQTSAGNLLAIPNSQYETNASTTPGTGTIHYSTAIPAAPTRVTATAGSGQLTLSWAATAGATSYSVYQGTTAGGESTTSVKTGVTGTSAVITGLVNGTTYYFKIAAVNSLGTSPLSAEVSAKPVAVPAAPTGVSATPGNAQVTLSWTASTGATSYNIYQGSAAGGESTTPVKTGITATTATITGLANGTAYYFKVAAVNGSGTSPLSAEVTAKPVLPVPTAPSTISAVAGNGQVTLAWSAVSVASSYNIYQGTTAGGESATAVKTGISGTSIVVTGLTNGTTYYFKVAAVNSSGTSPLSTEASAKPVLPLPGTPTGVTATAGNQQVTLSWTAAANATSYNVYQGTSAGGESTTPVKTGITGTSAVITGLTNGTTYYFEIVAVNSSGSSSQSAEVSSKPVLAAPVAPTGVTATAGNGQVTLSWTASATATSYNVYLSGSAGGETSSPQVSGITATSYVVSGLTNGNTYYFKIAAVNSAGTSPQSVEVTAKPAVPIPAAPTGISIVAQNAEVTLSWTASSGATSYNVYQGTTAGGESATPVKTGVTGTSTFITPLTNGTKYYFKIAAVNSSGTSPLSAEVSATPVVTVTGAPAAVSASPGNGQVSLTWGAVGGATSYNVYQGTSAGGEGTTPVKTGITGAGTVITGLTNGTTYYFKVAAVNSAGTSPLSAEVSARPVLLVPQAPVGVTATAANMQVTLSWVATTDATSYNVYQGSTANGESATPVRTGVTGTSIVITGLTNGSTYYFKIAAVNAAGTSPLSPEVSASPYLPIPSTPTSVVATASSGQVTVSWAASTNASTYNIYLSATAGGETSTPQITGIAGTSYVFSGLTNGNTYYFKVAAVNSAGTSPLSAEVSAKPVLTAPAAPTSISATAGNTQVTLGWAASSGATSYNVYEGTTAGGESTTPIKTGVTGTSVVVTGLTNGSTYYFKIAAVNTAGTSPLSAEVSAKPFLAIPSAPTGVTAKAGDEQVTLTWTATSGAASYNVYQGTTAGGESTSPIRTGITTATVTLTGLTDGTTYYYKIAAVNSSGTSPLSAEVSAKPIVMVPPAPNSVSATAASTSVTVRWNTAQVDVSSYNVYQGTTAGGESATPIITGATGPSVTINGLVNGTSYYYRVAAVNSAGTSPLSAEASATPEPTVPAAPTSIGGTPLDSEVYVTWVASTGATSYNVYEGTTSGGESTTPIMTGIPPGTGYAVKGLTNGTKYYFKVAAVNSAGTSPLSSEVGATPVAIPAAPTGVTATAGTKQVTVSWASSTGATSYNVYQGTTAGGESTTPVKTAITGNSYVITGLTTGTTYYFKVAAVNGSGTSPLSAEVRAIAQ